MPSLESVSTKRKRIAELAREAPDMVFTSLSHHIDIDWLREAYRATRKDGATGVDGQSAQAYAANLEANLQSLLNRAKSGSYWAPPVRRTQIPKGTGSETRPIGIPTFEDKVLQRAIVMLLENVYEEDFLDCSHGFRPNRSAHKALQSFWDQMMPMGGGWVVEVDIRKFFDSLDHKHLREILCKRVKDGVVLRLIGKWLNAGVMEGEVLSYPEAGSPQGGVISPLLANIYLHEVVDLWFEKMVKPVLKGRAIIIRYADDVLFGFQDEQDARRVLATLPKRFAKYGLTLHPTKTRLVRFKPPRPGEKGQERQGGSDPGSFDFLGFTHYWSRSLRGYWVIKRKTAKSRFARALRQISEWCRRNRHRPIEGQHRDLVRKLKGHDAYYGITGNGLMLNRLRYFVARIWFKWLRRRSQRRHHTQEWFWKILLKGHPLPNPRVVHSVYRSSANL